MPPPPLLARSPFSYSRAPAQAEPLLLRGHQLQVGHEAWMQALPCTQGAHLAATSSQSTCTEAPLRAGAEHAHPPRAHLLRLLKARAWLQALPRLLQEGADAVGRGEQA